MKKLLACLTAMIFFFMSFAQQPAVNDVILKVNGEELTGKVLKINDSDIEFAYAGETLTYTIKKTDIVKITFSSGRIEFFNKQPLTPSGQNGENAIAGPGLGDHHNKVAVLPFTVIQDGQAANAAVGEEVQNECFAFLNKHAGVFTILNPRTTNALLTKAGINQENIKGYTMDDLCNMLNVEYVVSGTVSMNRTSQTTYQSGSGSAKTKGNDKDDKKDTRYNSSSYGTTTQNYQTSLALSIFNDKGNSVYDQDRASFWNTQDAYKITLEYLLKRSPLYTK